MPSNPRPRTKNPKSELLERARRICLSLPEAIEKEAWGEATFRAGEKGKMFATFADNHHDDGRIALWCKGPDGAQSMLVASDPERFFVPPYWGPGGGIGLRLDVALDWALVELVLTDAYRCVANKRQLAQLDAALAQQTATSKQQKR